MIELWHYTCEHGRNGIGDRGELVPATELMRAEFEHPPTSRYVWLTDMSNPNRAALGLTSYYTGCDRLAHRYRVLDAPGAIRYVTVRNELPVQWRNELELAPGARLMHWWVSTAPVLVELADLDGAAVTA